MDLEQIPEGDALTSGEDEGVRLVRASEILPEAIPILPLDRRPYFPGLTMPLLLGGDFEEVLRKVAESEQKIVGLVMTRDEKQTPSSPGDLHAMGTACRVHRVLKTESRLQVLVEGLQRFSIRGWNRGEPPFAARVEYHHERLQRQDPEVKAYAVAIINDIKELVPLNPLYGEELKVFLEHFSPNEPARLADFAASLTTASRNELQEVLETVPLLARLQKVLVLIRKELEVAKAQARIQTEVEEELQGRQREVFLREQLKAIQKELGISKDDRTAEAERYTERLEGLEVPKKARQRIDQELEKFSVLETGSPEYAVTRNYLDWLTLMPWGRFTADSTDLQAARTTLDRDHEGLDDVKQRIIEFLGVGIMRGDVSGSILLLVGPPGVGKTSLGKSIAGALGREFFRFSLGGMRDEAEIKGHRRTYIGAMPGKFIQAIKDTGSANPVIMLDEIDKIGASFHGDPASALLEVLDPEQNASFLDHYLDVPFDLSKVLFICTANQLDTIPGPLLDRTEVIRLSGYLTDEKVEIAARHLLPRQLRKAGVGARDVRIARPVLRRIVEDYARDAGVRKLEKAIARVVRKAVVALLDGATGPIVVRVAELESYLGPPLFRDEARSVGVGVVTGLAWTAMGGATLSIEATRVHKAGREIKLTGQLGDVMRESAELAWNHVTANAAHYGIEDEFFRNAMVHVHVPAGATPKDGPSAGVTIALALVSLATGKRVAGEFALTGELTLTGQVLPVGGIREKLVAARRAGIRRVLLPEANRGEFGEVPGYVHEGLEIAFVRHFRDVVAAAIATPE